MRWYEKLLYPFVTFDHILNSYINVVSIWIQSVISLQKIVAILLIPGIFMFIYSPFFLTDATIFTYIWDILIFIFWVYVLRDTFKWMLQENLCITVWDEKVFRDAFSLRIVFSLWIGISCIIKVTSWINSTPVDFDNIACVGVLFLYLTGHFLTTTRKITL